MPDWLMMGMDECITAYGYLAAANFGILVELFCDIPEDSNSRIDPK
jgi:hypothetical protein